MRALAKRSATAAQEIKALITGSSQKVERGTRLVGEAGQAMGEILSRSDRMSTLVREISEASAQQRGGFEQIHAAMGDLDRVTQENAAVVEQTAAAAESLRRQTQALVEAVHGFSVAGA